MTGTLTRDGQLGEPLLATSDELVEFGRLAKARGRFAIDTEFVGEGRYQALLCLVQVAVYLDDAGADDLPWVLLVDPLDPHIDPAPLRAVLADPAIEVILHAARQDVALLRRIWETDVTRVFDTQIAAAFAGLRAQIGYDALLRALLGVKLRKSASFTKWDRRPLTAEQLSYAREDVLHLEAAAMQLQEQLLVRGRLQWAVQECEPLATSSDVRDIDQLFERLPKIAGLDPVTRAVARELVSWREATARRHDRPAQQVLGDQALAELARRRPATLDALRQIRGLGESNGRKRGEQLVAAIADGLKREPIPRRPIRQIDTRPEDVGVIALCEALLRTRAAAAGLAYELLATRNELQLLVSGARVGVEHDEVRVLAGWRRELVGDELLALLRGEHTLKVGPDGTVEIA
ncbi:MAG: HRDC domain-containing protein [Patulibacter sp.]